MLASYYKDIHQTPYNGEKRQYIIHHSVKRRLHGFKLHLSNRQRQYQNFIFSHSFISELITILVIDATTYRSMDIGAYTSNKGLFNIKGTHENFKPPTVGLYKVFDRSCLIYLDGEINDLLKQCRFEHSEMLYFCLWSTFHWTNDPTILLGSDRKFPRLWVFHLGTIFCLICLHVSFYASYVAVLYFVVLGTYVSTYST